MLSELFNTFHLTAQVYNNAQFCGNWKVESHSLDQTCFHMVTVGRCHMHISGQAHVDILELGDLVVFPRELDHSLVPFPEDLDTSGPMQMIKSDEAKPGTALLCGALLFEHTGFNHILDSLPKVFIIKAAQASWIAPLLFQIRQEMLHPSLGSDSIINRLSELLFIYALRHQLSQSDNHGFLNLYVHPTLAPAIKAIKRKPAHPWSLESLAKECAMSRTKFSQLFKKVSGITVNDYLTWWRMQLAYDYLMQGIMVNIVAEKVGYQSEAAFSRVFKKAFGVSPGKVKVVRG